MILCIAMILDALCGEPRLIWARIPHPAVVLGQGIGWATKQLNYGAARFVKGLGLTCGLCVCAAIFGWVLSYLGCVVEVLCVAVLIAQKSLVQHVQAVARDLRYSACEGRRRVAMIVGRDTSQMQRSDIARAAIESAAENLSDGVIAPVFWYVVAGLPGILVYKAINTTDSMIGYRTVEFEQFGKSAAVLDDILNYLPARITAVVILIAHVRWALWADMVIDAGKHRSPNAGWPESAMARVLNAALSGPRSYDGVHHPLPWVFEQGRIDLGARDIDRAVQALWRSWIVCLLLVFVSGMIFG